MKNNKKIRKYPSVVAIDFDETIGLFNPKEKKTKGYRVKEVTNVPNPRMVELISKLRSLGIRVVIYTSRWWGDYNSLIEWLEKYNIVVDDVLCGRFKADIYICDRTVFAHDKDMEDKVFNLLSKGPCWGQFYEKINEKHS